MQVAQSGAADADALAAELIPILVQGLRVEVGAGAA